MKLVPLAVWLVLAGLVDPFASPPLAARQANAAGFGELRQHRAAAARERFAAALRAAPGFTAARFSLATSYAAEAAWGQALAELEPVLAENYPRYAARVLVDPDWAPIKADRAQRQRLQELLDRARVSYGKQVSKGLLLVIQQRPPTESTSGDSTLVFHHQELYAFDAEHELIRQVTETSGQVVAFVRVGARVAYVTWQRFAGGVFGDLVLHELELTALAPGQERALHSAEPGITIGFDREGHVQVVGGAHGPETVTIERGGVRWHGATREEAIARQRRTGGSSRVEVKVGKSRVTMLPEHAAGLRGIPAP
jgi:hypothetical protein